MSWKIVEIASFLKERKGRFKPDDEEIKGLQRIEKIDFSGKIFLSEKPSKTNMMIIKKGDLVISGINVEKGAMAIYEGVSDVKATIHYSSYEYDKSKIDINFLSHFLKSQTFKNALKEQVPGGIKTEIKPKHILPLKVYIPTDIKEQKNVVKILDRRNDNVHSISTQLTHQLNLVKQLRQSFLREAMQGKLVAQNPNDEPAKKLLAKIKAEKEQLIKEKKIRKPKLLPPITNEEIPFEIPSNWVLTRIGEVCTKVTDGFHHTPKKLKEGKIYISATHIRENGIDWKNCQYIPEKEHKELFKKAYPKKGEILITNRGAGCATPVIIDIDKQFSFQNAALIGFNQSFTSNRYLYYFILKNRPEIMENFVNGGLQPMLSNVVLSKIPLPLPPLSEQQRIVAKLDELMAYCDSLEESIKNSQTQNEMLLEQVLREALEPKEKEVVI